MHYVVHCILGFHDVQEKSIHTLQWEKNSCTARNAGQDVWFGDRVFSIAATIPGAGYAKRNAKAWKFKR